MTNNYFTDKEVEKIADKACELVGAGKWSEKYKISLNLAVDAILGDKFEESNSVTIAMPDIKNGDLCFNVITVSDGSRKSKIFTNPELKEGELYAGLTISDNMKRHIILLSGEAVPDCQKNQINWAESIGGRLPNRVESALLFYAMKKEFKHGLYWTGEKYGDDYAWYCNFENGEQNYFGRYTQMPARAIRTVDI